MLSARWTQLVQVGELPPAFADRGDDLIGALGADAAGGAFAAAFEAEEVQQHFGQVDHAGIFVADQQRARTQRDPRFAEAIRNPSGYPAGLAG